MTDTSLPRIPFAGRSLTHGGRTFELPHQILDAIPFQHGVAVIYDYMEFPQGRPANNLVAFDAAGRELWTAENLNQPAAAYTRFVSASPLRANNFCSFQCTLDPTTGKIVESIFYK